MSVSLPYVCPLTCGASRTPVLSGLPDWSLLRTTEVENLAGWIERPDNFWLRPGTIDFQFRHPQGMETELLLLTHGPTGRRVVLTGQTFVFRAGSQASDAAKGETSRFDLRRRVLSPLSFRVYAVGQLLTSGSYAQHGLDRLTPPERAELLSALGRTVLAGQQNYSAVLLKDLLGKEEAANQLLLDEGYYALPVDPVLELPIRPEWRTVEDYLADLTSKYRVRYRRARGKFEGLARRKLSASEARERSGELYQLYRETSHGADFNLAELRPDYFRWLAGEAILTGYFDGAEMIAFSSLIPNGPVAHAHFLGMREAYKHSHHLYHNVLLDLLETTIGGGFRRLDYGRTASEIKTSIGAHPVEFTCLIRASCRVTNGLLPLFVPAVFTATEWTPRSPFREADC